MNINTISGLVKRDGRSSQARLGPLKINAYSLIYNSIGALQQSDKCLLHHKLLNLIDYSRSSPLFLGMVFKLKTI